MSVSKEVGKVNLDTGEPLFEFSDNLTKRSVPLISVKSITKQYHKKTILQEISFDIHKGDLFGLVGMSGSGKTTLFQLLTGMVRPDAGDILFNRKNLQQGKESNLEPTVVSVFNHQRELHKKVGFASQVTSFYNHLTVEENLRLYASLHSVPTVKVQENIKKLLNFVDLKSDAGTIASELSGGMKRRLDIACSMIHDPLVLFLDEPTSDLDPVMRKQIWALIIEINKKGTTVIISSHIIEEIEQLCSKVAILHESHILGAGSLQELKSVFKNIHQIRVQTENGRYDTLINLLKKEPGVERVVIKNKKLILFVDPEYKNIKKITKLIQSKAELTSMDVSDTTLVEIFESLSKKEVA